MREKIIPGNIYHVLSRGVDKRKIFLNNKDYFRFIHDLFEFNNKEPLKNLTYYFKKGQSKVSARPKIEEGRESRKLLVEILAFCLMPNHYHLLFRSLSSDGIVKFMKRLNMGYAKYFNEKYQRKGTLFEGRYKLVSVSKESHFIHLPYYIHLNPLDLIMPKWRKGKIEDYKKAFNFLENYRWSSYLDYIGEKNFPSVTQRDFLLEFFSGNKEYKKKIEGWIKERGLQNIKSILLE